MMLAEFEHWELHLASDAAPYLGRCVAWAKRADAERFTDMTQEESEELRKIVGLWFDALCDWLASEGQSKPYRENISILGNSEPHLHAHLIPRYEEPVTVFGMTFTDPRPHHHYKPYERTVIPDDVVAMIMHAMQKSLNSSHTKAP